MMGRRHAGPPAEVDALAEMIRETRSENLRVASAELGGGHVAFPDSFGRRGPRSRSSMFRRTWSSTLGREVRKVPTDAKSTKVAEIKEKLTSSESVILVDYRGLSVKDMQEFRVSVRDAGGEVKVYKNTLTQIALRELAMPTMDEYLAGPTGFVFGREDAAAPAKAIVDFAKAHQALEVKGGFVQNAVVDAATVKAIAALPTRDELLAKLMGMLLNPVRGFMAMANAPAGAFVRTVQAVADQKAAA